MDAPSMNVKQAVEVRMRSYVNRNADLLNNWHRKVVVEKESMSVEAIAALASSNYYATAASAILFELQYSHSADRLDATLTELIEQEMRSNGPKEMLTVYLEAQRALNSPLLVPNA